MLHSTTCPGCQKAIRIPGEALGQKAQCPFCKCHFWAPVATAEGLTDPQLHRRHPLGGSRLQLAATLTLFVGLIGIVTNGLLTLQYFTDREAFEAGGQSFFEQLADKTKTPEEKEAMLERLPEAQVWRPRIQMVSGILSCISVAAAVAMFRERGHGLAVVGSFVTMFNVAHCCCFFSIAVGGYSLFVLFNPDVRARFMRPAG